VPLYRITGGKLTLSLHEGQAAAWDSARRFVFVIAGTQSGKTSFGGWWLWREIQQTANPDGGDNDYIAATATFDLFKLKMLPELRAIFERALGIGRYWSGDRIIELCDPVTKRFWAKKADDPMWGRIILRSAEAGGGLESASARAAWLDECGQDSFTVETWEAVQRRLALYRGRCLGTTTPYNLGWLKAEIYDRWRAGNPDIAVVQFPSFVNPAISRDEYDRAQATMPAWRFAMFWDGELSRPAGMIYDCWDDRENVAQPFAVPPMWARRVGVDFGAVNTATVWMAHDPAADTHYLYAETLGGGKTTAEHAREWLGMGAGTNVVSFAGGAGSEDQPRRDFRNAGVTILRPPVADVEGGIARVYALIKTRRLKVFGTCKGILDEIGSYKRKLSPDGLTLEEIADKRTFHRLDALRYVATIIDAPQVRFRAY